MGLCTASALRRSIQTPPSPGGFQAARRAPERSLALGKNDLKVDFEPIFSDTEKYPWQTKVRNGPKTRLESSSSMTSASTATLAARKLRIILPGMTSTAI